MINTYDITENFNKYKPLLLEMFISYYGEEYRRTILKRFDNVYLNFSSTPDEEYKFWKIRKNELSSYEFNWVKNKYTLYKEEKNQFIEKGIKDIIHYIQVHLYIEKDSKQIDSFNFYEKIKKNIRFIYGSIIFYWVN